MEKIVTKILCDFKLNKIGLDEAVKKILNLNERKSVRKHSKATEVCPNCKSTKFYIHENGLRHCFRCDRLWQTG